MKKPLAEPTELRCPACDGTGFPKVTKTVPPGRKIYPAPCKECSGKGRIYRSNGSSRSLPALKARPFNWGFRSQLSNATPIHKLGPADSTICCAGSGRTQLGGQLPV